MYPLLICRVMINRVRLQRVFVFLSSFPSQNISHKHNIYNSFTTWGNIELCEHQLLIKCSEQELSFVFGRQAPSNKIVPTRRQINPTRKYNI